MLVGRDGGVSVPKTDWDYRPIRVSESSWSDPEIYMKVGFHFREYYWSNLIL
jgi:hypothetical protein